MNAGIQIICILAAGITGLVIIDGIAKFTHARRAIRDQLQRIRDADNAQNPPWEI